MLRRFANMMKLTREIQMLNNTYRHKYYLNINYLKSIKRKRKIVKESTPVTFEITVTIFSRIGGHITFSFLEELLERTWGPYQLSQINDIEPFDKIEPNSENIVIFLKNAIEKDLIDRDCEILSIEIGETPLQFYIYNNRNQKVYQRIKTYLNIFHAIEQEGVLGEKHEHSLELNCVATGDFNLKACVEEAMQFYQGRYLNELMYFKKINPTLENISLLFKQELEEAAHEKGGEIQSLEVAERSSIAYIC